MSYGCAKAAGSSERPQLRFRTPRAFARAHLEDEQFGKFRPLVD